MANTKVTSGVIKDDAVGADQLASNSVVTASIVDNAITTAKINNDAILTAKISNSAVTNAKLAANSVDSDQYVDGSIDTAHIADGQITSAKLDTNISVSGTLTVGSHLSLGDSDEIRIGDSSDLKIYHDGSNSYVSDEGAGNLILRGGLIALQNAGSTQNLAQFTDGGASQLFYAGAEKLATTSSGIDVTGTVTADGLTVNSSEVLFDNTGGDFTLKLNTNAVSDKNEIIMGDSGTPLAKFGVGGTANDIITGSDGQDFNIGTAGGGRAINFSTDNFASVEMKLDGGNLGIGETNPDASLHITSNTPVISFDESDAGQEFRIGSFGGAFALYDSTDSAYRLVVDGSGNLGIGVTSILQGYKLEVDGNIVIPSGNFLANRRADGGNYGLIRGNDSGTTILGDSQSVHILSSGNVGIGTDSPSTELHVKNATDCTLLLQSGDGSTAEILFGDASDTSRGKIKYLSTDEMTFEVNNLAEAMRIDSSQNLLVGVSTFANNTLGVAIRGASTGATDESIRCAVPSTGSTLQIGFFNANGRVGSISTSGSSTAFNTSSDYRLKENVDYDFTALDRVAQLKPARFNFIANADKTVDGFLAHEVQDIVPEAITGEKDAVREEEYEITPAVLDDDGNVVTEAEMGTKEVPEYQGIDQSKLIPLLTKAIQEQQTQIETLKQEIQELKG